MNKMIRFVGLLIVSILTMQFIIGSSYVFAGEGGDGGGGGQSCDGGFLCTDYGARWQWYPIGASDPDVIHIPGLYRNGKYEEYAYGGDITGCKSVGGYWRYAMVASRDENGEVDKGGRRLSIKAGEQVGLISIGSSDSIFRSSYFGGGMVYRSRDSNAASWDAVSKYYSELSKQYPTTFTRGWDSASTLAWFCGEKDMQIKTAEYYGQSNVPHGASDSLLSGIAKSGGWATTGQVKTFSTVGVERGGLTVGGSTTAVFSHNPYTSVPVDNVGWKVYRIAAYSYNGDNRSWEGMQSGNYADYYTISASSNRNRASGSYAYESSGISNLVESAEDTDGLYRSNNRPYTDGIYWFVLRDEYTITFKKKGTYKFCEDLHVNGVRYTRACMTFIVGDGPIIVSGDCSRWTPASYTSSWKEYGTTSVVARVKNSTLGEDYGTGTYAKPTDRVDWINCYYPGMQTVANTLVTTNHYDNRELSGLTYNLLYRALSSYKSWTNSFSVAGTNFTAPGLNNYSYPYGDSTTRQVDVPYNVQHGSGVNKAGKALTDSITSGPPTIASVTHRGQHSWRCHWRQNESECGTHEECKTRLVWKETTDDDGNVISRGYVREKYDCKDVVNYCYIDICSHSQDFIDNSVGGGQAKDQASVQVPYNFNNSSAIELKSNVVYAGETATIKNVSVTISPRDNVSLRGDYATNVDEAQVKIVGYLSDVDYGSANTSFAGSNMCGGFTYKDLCNELNTISTDGNGRTLTLNQGGYSTGDVVDNIYLRRTDYNVYDEDAGQYFCVRAAIYPSSSGNTDYQMNASGSGTWYISEPSCAIIAKKPSLEVWGGSFYSAGNVTTATSNKINLGTNYNTTATVATHNFGSWVDYGMASLGIVKGLASGATLGKDEGYGKSSYCSQVPLSFANRSLNGANGVCTGLFTGSSTGSIGTGGSTINKHDLVSYLKDKIESENYHTDEDKIGEMTIGANKTVVYDNGNGDIEINGDIKYAAEEYGSLDEAPQLIIYAKNINISCNVETIDAILIAENTVDTCSNPKDGVTSDEGVGIFGREASNRSHQLKITGMVIADKLIAGRTYGAATGDNSGKPAEIINYDTKTILWANAKADTSSSNTLNITYQHELAPRY